ncbi:hypothetical protein A3D77_01230 [Candidatus Gottesmanbacteria bacterium RIFCSPHIGHO2_02_FULL_39_11]|uniref:Uncharacterized protein n=1 Tax=Candidatus Gottesmanbacteria bacterium RIFCSPHIGHO2_02_FULL_39_11 TaxID=1798382 RepID=A0A1F5ZU33_9BACT|nr:MAG: hypothetical protein A3D77_01230 [Candidatus Gottesmanbacteria bacterium RIFCSPHIGHO2_02_FULL_39_11]
MRFLYVLATLMLLIFKSVGDTTLGLIQLIFSLLKITYKIIVWLTRLLIKIIKRIEHTGSLFIRSVLFILLSKYKESKENFRISSSKVSTDVLTYLLGHINLPRVHFKLEMKLPVISFFSRVITAVKFFLLGASIAGMIFLYFYLKYLVTSLPNPTYLTQRDIATSTKIFDRKGILLYEIYADENRTPLSFTDIPKDVKNATIAIEDRNFYTNKGFSLRGIIRALYHNYETSETVEGGSTITQQLVRSALLTPEKTIARKAKEIVISFWAEQIYSKDHILEMYLNQVPYGGTAWGIEAAAQTYFGKSAKDLKLSEAALLAGLPAAPSLYSPTGAHPELAKERQKEVLHQMKEQGYITQEEENKAKEDSLIYRHPTVPIAAPHFVMYVKDYLEKLYGTRKVEKGGLRVVTTLDLSIQQMAEKVVSEEVGKLGSLSVGNGAAVVVNPQNGEILAMVGSKDYFELQWGSVNLTTALRQPGSSIKVVTYAAALSHGFTPASILEDTPITYHMEGQPDYSPVNYDGRFHGLIPLRTALASSYNIPAVKVLNKIGIDTMLDTGKAMGITTWPDRSKYGLSLTLGGGDITMFDMATVYSTLARGGEKKELNPILKLTTWKEENLIIPSPVVQQAISPEVSYLLSNILSDNIARTPAFGPNSSLVIPGHTVSVKTGTTDNKRDNWTIGYTNDFVVATWVGNNDNSPMNPSLTSGVTGAAPIWNQIMSSLLKDKPDHPFDIPPGIVSVPCYGRVEYFISGTEPKGRCSPLPTFPTYTPAPR